MANKIIIRVPTGIKVLEEVTIKLIIKNRTMISSQRSKRKIWVLIFIIFKIRRKNKDSIIIRRFIVFRCEPISDLQNQCLYFGFKYFSVLAS